MLRPAHESGENRCYRRSTFSTRVSAAAGSASPGRTNLTVDYGGRRPDSSSDRSRCSRHCPISTAACFSCGPHFGEQGQQAGVDLVDWHSALALLTSRPVEPPGGGPVRSLTSRASSTPLEGQVGILRPTGTNLGTELGSIGDEYTAQ